MKYNHSCRQPGIFPHPTEENRLQWYREFVYLNNLVPDELIDTAKLWYTPEGLIQWLKTADIPQLTKEDKERLGLE